MAIRNNCIGGTWGSLNECQPFKSIHEDESGIIQQEYKMSGAHCRLKVAD